MSTLRRASTASWHGPRRDMSDEENGLKTRQTKETSEQGKVKWSVYWEYAKESNLYAVGMYLIALLAAQTTQVLGGFWLKHWSEVNEEAGGNPDVAKYIGIYTAFGLGSSSLSVVQTLILWIFCSIEVCGCGFRSLRSYLRSNCRHRGNSTSGWHTPSLGRQ